MIKTSNESPPINFIEVSSIFLMKGANGNRKFHQFKVTSMGKFFIKKESERLNAPAVVTLRSKGDVAKRYCSSNVFDAFVEWNMYRVNPNKSEYLIREENAFCKVIENTFKDILTFVRQYKVLNYTVDLYCIELNLFIEFDEKHHKYNNDSDNNRESYIIKETNGRFLRHNENLDISITLNKIIKYIL